MRRCVHKRRSPTHALACFARGHAHRRAPPGEWNVLMPMHEPTGVSLMPNLAPVLEYPLVRDLPRLSPSASYFIPA